MLSNRNLHNRHFFVHNPVQKPCVLMAGNNWMIFNSIDTFTIDESEEPSAERNAGMKGERII